MEVLKNHELALLRKYFDGLNDKALNQIALENGYSTLLSRVKEASRHQLEAFHQEFDSRVQAAQQGLVDTAPTRQQYIDQQLGQIEHSQQVHAQKWYEVSSTLGMAQDSPQEVTPIPEEEISALTNFLIENRSSLSPGQQVLLGLQLGDKIARNQPITPILDNFFPKIE